MPIRIKYLWENVTSKGNFYIKIEGKAVRDLSTTVHTIRLEITIINYFFLYIFRAYGIETIDRIFTIFPLISL